MNRQLLSATGLALVAMVAAASARADTFDSAGVKIHYTVEGQGQPVVLIHGLYSNATMNWRLPGTLGALAEKYQVIALDVRGHGQSDKPIKDADYGVEMAEDVIRLLDHLKIDRAHVVGYSMGGLITMRLLVDHPDRVRSAVLGGMGWLPQGSPLQKFWEQSAGRRRRPEGGTPQVCVSSLARLAVTEAEVKALKVPVSVVVGERDPVERLYVDPLKRLRDDWPITVVPGAGHLTCVSKPEFKAAVLAHLDRHSR